MSIKFRVTEENRNRRKKLRNYEEGIPYGSRKRHLHLRFEEEHRIEQPRFSAKQETKGSHSYDLRRSIYELGVIHSNKYILFV